MIRPQLCNKHTATGGILGHRAFGKYKVTVLLHKNNLRIYRLVKAETQALDVNKPVTFLNLPDGAFLHKGCMHFQAGISNI